MASGRSVRMIWEVLGKVWESVTPTTPQPAPSSRTLRLFCTSAFCRVGSFGRSSRRGEGMETDVRYDDRTRPASLGVMSLVE